MQQFVHSQTLQMKPLETGSYVQSTVKLQTMNNKAIKIVQETEESARVAMAVYQKSAADHLSTGNRKSE